MIRSEVTIGTFLVFHRQLPCLREYGFRPLNGDCSISLPAVWKVFDMLGKVAVLGARVHSSQVACLTLKTKLYSLFISNQFRPNEIWKSGQTSHLLHVSSLSTLPFLSVAHWSNVFRPYITGSHEKTSSLGL